MSLNNCEKMLDDNITPIFGHGRSTVNLFQNGLELYKGVLLKVFCQLKSFFNRIVSFISEYSALLQTFGRLLLL